MWTGSGEKGGGQAGKQGQYEIRILKYEIRILKYEFGLKISIHGRFPQEEVKWGQRGTQNFSWITEEPNISVG